jgi:hypothetical protein
MDKMAAAATIIGAFVAILSLIISVLAFRQVDPHSPRLRRVGLGTSVVVLVGLAFLAGFAIGSPPSHSSTVVSSTVVSSTVKPIYRETWVRVAQKSLYRVKHPGEELSSRFLLHNNIRIDWNGEGTVYLSGDNNGPAPVWVDDILDISIVNPDGQEQPYYKDFSNNCTKGVNSGGAGVDLTKYLEPGTNAIQITITDNANCAGKNATVGSSDIFLHGVFRKLP